MTDLTPQDPAPEQVAVEAQAAEPSDASGTIATAAETPSPGRSDRSAQRRSRTIRLVVLGAILAFMTAFSYLHQTSPSFKPVGVDALCPFGGVETLWALMSGGVLVKKIAVSSLILLGITLLIAVIFGRSFCGYLCPLGALQEFVGKLRKFFGIKGRLQVPASIDRYARLLKYGVLALFTAWTWSAAQLVIRPYDPWVAWTHITSAELFAEFSIGLAILLVSLAGSIAYDRFFCKYLCPMGALLGIIAPFSMFKVRRNEATCTNCSACDKACPVNIKVSAVAEVRNSECLACNECVNSCPVAHTLEVADSSRMVFTPNKVIGTVAALSLSVLAVTTVGGLFNWTMPTAAQAITIPGGGINAEEIRGSMTFAEISAATGIAPEAFQQQFGVSAGDMDTKIKDLAPVYGFDVHTDVREWVAAQAAAGAATGGAVQGVQSGGTGSGEGEMPAGED